MSGQTTVVVIGGGVAGLACATKLASTPGFAVTLLDASDRVGGRIKSVKFGDQSVELGAQWVHGEDKNSVFSLVHPLGVLEDRTSGNSGCCKSGSFVTQNGEFLSESVREKVLDVLTKLEVQPEKGIPENESLGQHVTRKFWKLNETNRIHESEAVCAGILDWIHRYQNIDDGSESWFVTSYRGQMNYSTCEGNQSIAWKYPATYSTLLETILQGIPSGEYYLTIRVPEWIHLKKEVCKITYSDEVGGNVVVRCKDNSKYEAHHVVCTLSLGVLKHDHATMFDPPLPPEKINAIENIGFGTVNKIFMEFKSVWWPENSGGFNLVWDDCCKVNENWLPEANHTILLQEDAGIPVWCRSLIGFYTLIDRPKCLYTWITGPPAILMESLDNDALEAALMKVLQKFVGSIFAVTSPTLILRSKWNSNPRTRGSYSFRTIHSEESNASAEQLAQPIMTPRKTPVLCFAGEATHSTYYSTVHGAYDTGLREAERLIKYANRTATEKMDDEDDEDSGFCCSILDFV